MLRTWVIVSALTLVLTNASSVSAQQPSTGTATVEPPAEKKDRLRDEQREYLGRSVRVHRTDGTTTIGVLIGETAEGLAVQASPSDEPVLIPYEEVQSIATGMPRWQKIALAVGGVGAALLAVALK